MKEVKPVVIEKNEFEYRDLSESMGFFFSSSTIRIPTEAIIILSNSLSQIEGVLVEPLIQTAELVVLKNHEFENGVLYLLIAFFPFSACQDLEVEKNNYDF